MGYRLTDGFLAIFNHSIVLCGGIEHDGKKYYYGELTCTSNRCHDKTAHTVIPVYPVIDDFDSPL